MDTRCDGNKKERKETRNMVGPKQNLIAIQQSEAFANALSSQLASIKAGLRKKIYIRIAGNRSPMTISKESTIIITLTCDTLTAVRARMLRAIVPATPTTRPTAPPPILSTIRRKWEGGEEKERERERQTVCACTPILLKHAIIDGENGRVGHLGVFRPVFWHILCGFELPLKLYKGIRIMSTETQFHKGAACLLQTLFADFNLVYAKLFCDKGQNMEGH
jgi:hypothetical protein